MKTFVSHNICLSRLAPLPGTGGKSGHPFEKHSLKTLVVGLHFSRVLSFAYFQRPMGVRGSWTFEDLKSSSSEVLKFWSREVLIIVKFWSSRTKGPRDSTSTASHPFLVLLQMFAPSVLEIVVFCEDEEGKRMLLLDIRLMALQPQIVKNKIV